jgi:hypothetical protein
MTTNTADNPSHRATSPLSGVHTVPADGGVTMPIGGNTPVPSKPGAPNAAATNERPNTRPAPVDAWNMPVPRQ